MQRLEQRVNEYVRQVEDLARTIKLCRRTMKLRERTIREKVERIQGRFDNIREEKDRSDHVGAINRGTPGAIGSLQGYSEHRQPSARSPGRN